MPFRADPVALMRAVALLMEQYATGKSDGKPSGVLEIENLLKGSSPEPVEIYLDQFGLMETLDCLAMAPDILGLDWDEADRRLVLIEQLIRKLASPTGKTFDS